MYTDMYKVILIDLHNYCHKYSFNVNIYVVTSYEIFTLQQYLSNQDLSRMMNW